MIWLGEAVAITFAVWFVLAILHMYRAEHRALRCVHCGRPCISAIDRSLHQVDCQRPPLAASRRDVSPPRRVGTHANTRSPHRHP